MPYPDQCANKHERTKDEERQAHENQRDDEGQVVGDVVVSGECDEGGYDGKWERDDRDRRSHDGERGALFGQNQLRSRYVS